MKNEEGKMTSDKEEIKQIYKEFYEKLFEKKKELSEDEQKIENNIWQCIEKIKKVATKQEPLNIEEELIRKVVKKLKRRKASDSEGWRNELIVEGGNEMIKSLTILFNEIHEKMEFPEQWERMLVKSVYKNKGKKSEMKNRRGIFLTSVIGKVFEKTVLKKVEGDIKVCKFQNGGRKERSAKDNLLSLMAVVDRNKELKNNTYVLFADAEKCFDQLWLEDCIVDITEDGLREREAILLYKLNEKAEMKVITTCGNTEEINIERVVKQGTIFDLCYAAVILQR